MRTSDLGGWTQDTAGFPENIIGSDGRLVRSREAGCIALAGTKLPRAFEGAFEKVVHDERRGTEESSRSAAGGLIDANGEFIPLSLVECSRGNFVTMQLILTILIIGRKRTAGP